MDTLLLKPNEDPSAVATAAEILRRGGLVAIPTETVYGLAADALNEDAVKKIYIAKGRPSDNPLIVHIAEFDEIYALVREVPEKAKKLARHFWPGPLTIILPKTDAVPSTVSGGLSTVAIRMPSHPTARAVIKASGKPLAAPSANISGLPSPTAIEYVIDDMTGRIDAIVDGGNCSVGVESTVLSLAGDKPRLLRPGGITAEMLRDVIGEIEIDEAVLHPLAQGATAASPGMKYKHYSPKADITIVRGTPEEYRCFLDRHRNEDITALCFEEDTEHISVPYVTMGSEKDPLSVCERLFGALRELDEINAHKVFSRCPSSEGLGLAVCNRLFRSAGFKFIQAAPVIGLTGQTGAGKSTLAKLLKQRGFTIIDCDEEARSITAPGSGVLQLLAAEFGKDILKPDGTLERRLLAERAFASPDKTARLNSITHPAITERVRLAVDKAKKASSPCVIDAPLLFESGLDRICDFTVAVTAPESIRTERIIKRDGISRQAALMRMGTQRSEKQYSDMADYVLKNYPPFELSEEIKSLPI